MSSKQYQTHIEIEPGIIAVYDPEDDPDCAYYTDPETNEEVAVSIK